MMHDMGGLKERIQFTEKQVGRMAACSDRDALDDALAGILIELRRKDPLFLKAEPKELFFNMLFVLKEKQPVLYTSKELSRYKNARTHQPLLGKAFEAELFSAVDESPFFLMSSDLAKLGIDAGKAQHFISSQKSRVRFAKLAEIPCYRIIQIDKLLGKVGLKHSSHVFFTKNDQITEEALAKKTKAAQT